MIDMEKGSYVHQYIDGEVLLNLLKIVKNKEIDLAQENRKKRNSVKQCIHENQAGFCQQIIDTIKAMQTADVRPVVRGEWVKTHRHPNRYWTYTGFDDMGEEHTITVHEEFEYDWLNCPYCGASAADNFQSFCPRCGADMRKEADDA